MRVSKIFTLVLVALVLGIVTLPDFVDAKRTGSSSRSSRGGRSTSRSRRGGSSHYGGNYYTGIIVIAGPNGYTYQGYGA